MAEPEQPAQRQEHNSVAGGVRRVFVVSAGVAVLSILLLFLVGGLWSPRQQTNNIRQSASGSKTQQTFAKTETPSLTCGHDHFRETFVAVRLFESYIIKFFEPFSNPHENAGIWTDGESLKKAETLLDHVFKNCFEHSCKIYSKATHDEITKEEQLKTYSPGNGFFVDCSTCPEEQRVMWFQHTWDGLTVDCVRKHGSVAKCVKTLDTKMQEFFKCTMLSGKDYEKIAFGFGKVLYPFRKDGKLIPVENVPYVYPQLGRDRFGVFDITHQGLPAKVIFSPAVWIEPDTQHERLKLSTQYEDVSEFFALHVWLDVLVRSPAPDDDNMMGRTNWGNSKVGALDVKANILHDFVVDPKKTPMQWTEDNSRILYTVPRNTTSYLDYWVCTMDGARNTEDMFKGSALFCWHDKQLNTNLRCNSIPIALIQINDPEGDPEMVPYEQTDQKLMHIYADCPPHWKGNVFKNAKKSMARDYVTMRGMKVA
ncbi:hypothetical protein L596_030768 [Steinernema carpocapsae]|uniref:Uncharacterized protein n=1 Tax=Steinernema carpocapsae TaxID=34508 RepID=A0A4V5ZWU5_STECR|nr:hypothetical protein L596_030768 [Steinernema carpocapsae]